MLVVFRSSEGCSSFEVDLVHCCDTEYVHSGFESRLNTFERPSCKYGGSGVKSRFVLVEAGAATFGLAATLLLTEGGLFPAGMAATRTVWYC